MSAAAINDLGGAIRSFIYYVASCSTVRKVAYRRKREKEAAQARVEKQQLEMEQPDLYRHPLPFATNPNWDEDIRLGPGPFKRERRKTEKKESKWAQMMMGEEAERDVSMEEGAVAGEISVLETSTATEVIKVEENWNKKRYQRQDEHLWGNDDDDPPPLKGKRPRSATQGSSVRATTTYRSTRMLRTVKSMPYHRQVRCPSVNELHPPVVSSPPTQGSEMQWMLQPPPAAKIMEGKEPANRSRATSGASSKGKQSSGKLSLGMNSSSQPGTSSISRSTVSEISTPGSKGRRRANSSQIEEDFAASKSTRDKDRPPIPTPGDESPSPLSSPIALNSPTVPLAARIKQDSPQLPLTDLLPPLSSALNSRNTSPSADHDTKENKDDPQRLESVFSFNFKFPDSQAKLDKPTGKSPKQRTLSG